MRCYICDQALGLKEISYDFRHQRWNPCHSCLEKSKLGDVYEGVGGVLTSVDADDILLVIEEDEFENGVIYSIDYAPD